MSQSFIRYLTPETAIETTKKLVEVQNILQDISVESPFKPAQQYLDAPHKFGLVVLQASKIELALKYCAHSEEYSGSREAALAWCTEYIESAYEAPIEAAITGISVLNETKNSKRAAKSGILVANLGVTQHEVGTAAALNSIRTISGSDDIFPPQKPHVVLGYGYLDTLLGLVETAENALNEAGLEQLSYDGVKAVIRGN